MHAHMFSPNMAFITPTPMNMPSISRLEKTIVAMEQVFQLRSLHMAARTNQWRFCRFVVRPATASYRRKGLKRADAIASVGFRGPTTASTRWSRQSAAAHRRGVAADVREFHRVSRNYVLLLIAPRAEITKVPNNRLKALARKAISAAGASGPAASHPCATCLGGPAPSSSTRGLSCWLHAASRTTISSCESSESREPRGGEPRGAS